MIVIATSSPSAHWLQRQGVCEETSSREDPDEEDNRNARGEDKETQGR